MFLEFVYKADVSIGDNGYRSAVKVVDLSDKDTEYVFGDIYYMIRDVVSYLR